MPKYKNKPVLSGSQPFIEVELWRRKWCKPKKGYKGPKALIAEIITNASKPSTTAPASSNTETSDSGFDPNAPSNYNVGYNPSGGGNTGGTEEGGEEKKKVGPTLKEGGHMLENIAEIALYRYLNDCPIESKWILRGVLDLSYSNDITQSTGAGTLTLLYSNERYKRIRQGDEIIIRVGWIDPNGDKRFTEPIHGFVAEVKKEKRQLIIEFCDMGVLLERECKETYQNKKRSYILKELIKKAGLEPVIDLGDISDITMSFTPESSSSGSSGGGGGSPAPGAPSDLGGGGVGPNNAHGIFWKSCWRSDCPLPIFGSRQGVQCTCTGKCPQCGSDKIVYNRCPPGCAYNPCQGVGSANASQAGANQFPEGHFFCCACDADYCGCGIEHVVGSSARLPTSCGSGTSASTGGSGGNQKNEKMTYWDAIQKVLEDVEYEVEVFVLKEKCYVRKIPVPEDAEHLFAAWGGYNLIDESFSVTEGKGPVISGLRIKTKEGREYLVIDHDWDKYGDLGVAKLAYPELSLDEARKKGERILRALQRENSETVNVEIGGDGEIWVGGWAHIKSQEHDYDGKRFINKFEIEYSADQTFQNKLECANWKPPLDQGGEGEGSERRSNITTGGGSGGVTRYGGGQLNGLSGYEGLQKLANYICQNLNHCLGCCTTADCVERTKRGDCWGLSDWAACVLRDNGYKVRVVQGVTTVSNHRWCEVWMDGRWYPFDPSACTPRYGCKGPGFTWSKPYMVVKNYF